MSRPENRMVMGYFAFDEKHHPALLSLVQPATTAHKLLDPFAGEGHVLEAMAKAWRVTPYANELDGARAEACLNRFGATHAVRCDAERLSASQGAFAALWVNPPYDHDTQGTGSKRLEFKYLKHSWKWACEGALVFWVVYQHHLTQEALAFLARHSRTVDVWGCAGKHLGEYDQVVVVAVKGTPEDSEALFADLQQQKENPTLLTMQDTPCYTLPVAPKKDRFVFAPDMLDAEQGLRLLQASGAWQNNAFQTLLALPPEPKKMEPIVAPRPGHMALVLAAGVANGAIITTQQHGEVALRSKVVPVEAVVKVEQSENAQGHTSTTTTIRLKPKNTLTLLKRDGDVITLDGDDALLSFITDNRHALTKYISQQFTPKYTFDFNGLNSWLSQIRLGGKHKLYTAQKHVIAAIVKGFETRKGILLSGQMGSGKSAMGSAVAVALLRKAHAEQVALIVAPPHLIDKWQREILSVAPQAFVAKLNRHEDVKHFMTKSALLSQRIPKIGLVKRDMVKLGTPREVAVVWKTRATARWHWLAPAPEGMSRHDRLSKTRLPTCPACGVTVYQSNKDGALLATEAWLKQGKRQCGNCHTPLWQEGREKSSQPAAGEKYPRKNPRISLDRYLKRVYPDRIAVLVWDEVHEAKDGARGNGTAFSRLASCAGKVLGLTGTPFNGRSSSLFNIEYTLNPRVRERYAWGGGTRLNKKQRGKRHYQDIAQSNTYQRGRAESEWVRDMGILECKKEERPQYDSATGVYTGTNSYQRPYEEAPGISPLLVAEMLDHTVYFALKDLGKTLPDFVEVALPVPLDADADALYQQTRTQLIDYLMQCRYQGDGTFKGAYFYWAMDWQDALFRPYEVIHNRKNALTGIKEAHKLMTLPSLGETRIYAKEQRLIELVREELAANRPCVLYMRQTQERDIQPRYAQLLEQHVPEAKPFILRSSVGAERREKVIDAAVQGGANVIICNPEIVKTGLDLLPFVTLIFVELTFNLATMMQAAARSYRLNQTHNLCKVIYMYHEGTMEETAVELMSRKQRAAKLLTGDIGLTGLDAITEGEGGFEQALLDAILAEKTLVDPSELFKHNTTEESAIEQDDLAFWNVAIDDEEESPALPVAVRVDTAPMRVEVETAPTPLVPATHKILPFPTEKARRGRKVNLNRLPDELAMVVNASPVSRPKASDEDQPYQLSLF